MALGTNRPGRFPQWATAILGAVTLLALAILVLSIILGVRAGQRQLELRRQQEIAIALQKAVDYRAEGRLEESLVEYRRVLNLDPSNPAAGEGLEALLQIARGTQIAGQPAPVAAVTTDSAAAPIAVVPTAAIAPATAVSAGAAPGSEAMLRPQAVLPAATLTGAAGTATLATPTLSAAPTGDLMTQAQTAFRAGRWQAAVDLLTQLQRTPAGQGEGVTAMLFDAYINLATEKDNEDNLEAALALYDKALILRPSAAEVRSERDLIDTYIDMTQVYGVDWEQAVGLLTQLYARDPQYRDVEERLGEALQAYSDTLGAAGDWCEAATQLDAATAISTEPALLAKRDQVRLACTSGTPPAADAAAASADSAPADTAPPRPAGGAPATGQLLYSARDLVDGRNLIFAQPVTGGAPSVLVENGAQPALRADGVRVAYRNLRSDQGGISAYDPASGIFFRITDYTEDILPSWDPGNGRVAFASNREGDRRWRIYVAWAEEMGEVSMLGYGESPAWSPASDLIAYRGCNDSGNNCGLWLMNSAGSSSRALTTLAADNRPAWSADGRFIAFMSDGRDGNMEIYRVDVASGQVTRLTNNGAIDAVPTVSPDGAWVAFLSNRDGGWKLWAVPAAGGTELLVASLKGDLGDWHSQGLQWIP